MKSSIDAACELSEWQRRNIVSLRETVFAPASVSNVTALAYYFRPADRLDEDFLSTEFALLQTFKTQGLLRAVLVVNEQTPKISSFCQRYGIELQIETDLIPGQIKTLALDLVGKLHERFSTDYVLIVQDDGFPLRPGLAEFVGKYDYIGAPWERHMTYYDFYPEQYRVGNGGFSLRSKRLCQEASRLYRKWFRRMPYWWYLLGDDTFYCKTLRFWFPAYRRAFHWATPKEAARFSAENGCWTALGDGTLPLGFHAQRGWETIRSKVLAVEEAFHA